MKKQNIQDKIKLVRDMKRPIVVVNPKDAETLTQLTQEAKEGLIVVVSKSDLIEQGGVLVYDYEEVGDKIKGIKKESQEN